MHEGKWAWQHDGSVAKYTNWKPGQPDNYYDEDALMVFSATRMWNDGEVASGDRGCFVCERYPLERKCSIVT